MVFEGAFGIALVFLAEAAKVQRVVLARGMDVVGEQIVVGDQVALVGVVPEPARIFDQLTIVVDQGVVDGNHAILTIARLWVLLQPLESVSIDTVRLPRRFSQPAIEARLVRAISELTGDPTHRLVFGHQEAGQILGEVSS